MTKLQANLADVRLRMERAALRAGRRVSDIKLVSISKTHPVKTLKRAMDAGLTVFGENKIQEAEPKILAIDRERAEWHFVGHLQSNKARKAVQLFDVIHSLDSIELAARLERVCEEEERAELPVYVQVDLAREATKSGISEHEMPVLIEHLRRCRRLKFNGLMLLPPYFEEPNDARPFFKRLREIRDRLARERAFASGAGELSMGMSHDFEIAIEEGATIVRIGTAIFGERAV